MLPLIITVTIIVCIPAALGGFFGIRKANSEHKGKAGEQKVRSALEEVSLPSDILLNDVIFANPENGMTSQIDHILISTRGVFVIETKNYSGYIYGDDERHEWTQSLNYGNTVNKFHSPIKQNKTHLYLVNKFLNNKYPVIGLVVFVQGNIENINSSQVYTLNGMKACIAHHSEILTPDDIQTINSILLSKIESATTERQHVENIREMKQKIDNNICPRCGGQLVLRNGKYGSFYGCSNYPKCKFTKQDK